MHLNATFAIIGDAIESKVCTEVSNQNINKFNEATKDYK